MYQIIKTIIDEETKLSIKRTDSNDSVTYIPMSEDNADYRRYLKWVAEGNEPLPADEE
jgi:hypothetical protein